MKDHREACACLRTNTSAARTNFLIGTMLLELSGCRRAALPVSTRAISAESRPRTCRVDRHRAQQCIEQTEPRQSSQERLVRAHLVARVHEPYLLAELVRFLRRTIERQERCTEPGWDMVKKTDGRPCAPWQGYHHEERGAARTASAWPMPDREKPRCSRLQRRAGASCPRLLLAGISQTLAAPAREAQPYHPASACPAELTPSPPPRLRLGRDGTPRPGSTTPLGDQQS